VALRIDNERVSNRAWSDVDKSAIWQRLKQALQDGEEGAAAAVREMYAVVKADVNADLTQADCWGPHHEIVNGTLVLNRNGLIAAAQALAGARAEPNLTPEQRRQAARHLLRHYRSLNMEPPASLLQLAGEQVEGEMARVEARVISEMRVEDVPLAPWAVDAVKELKAGDDNPMEVVVRIPEGKSKRGWYYTRRVLERIAQEINSTGLPGFLGHQKPENVSTEFPTPVTHWVGAVVRDEGGKAALYARGVIDKAADDLKRWIRGKVTRQVSIFGMAQLAQESGTTQVVDFRPLSIDWTPLNRAGMPTSVVAVGEMDSTFEDFVGTGPVPALAKPSGGDEHMNIQELLAQLKEAVAKKHTTVAAVIGEMGLDFETVAKEVGGDQYRELKERADVVGEMAEVFGLSREAKPDEVLAAAKAAREAQLEVARAKREKLIDKVVGEMVTAEAARPLIKRMLRVPENADEEQIRKLVGEMLEQEDVKQAFASLFRETTIRPQNTAHPNAVSGASVVRVRI